jgi:hypothetical protein
VRKKRTRCALHRGCQVAAQSGKLLGIHDRLEATLPWMRQPFTYTAYFEKRVGVQAGARGGQLVELRNIAEHLGLRRSSEDQWRVADRVFGGTAAFRSGVAGGWRGSFTEEHEDTFKAVASQLLVEMGYANNNNR